MNDVRMLADERKMDIVVNYATDAAVADLIERSNSIKTTYDVTSKKLAVSPEIALDSFINIYLRSYNMSNSEANRAYVRQELLKSFCVVDYDGYYIASLEQITASPVTKDLVFSIKQPYIYAPADHANVRYALNLDLVSGVRFIDGESTLTRVVVPISSTQQKQVINSVVTKAIMGQITKSQMLTLNETFFLPESLTALERTNPIEGVTVLAYILQGNVQSRRNLSAFAIGGTKIREVRPVLAYVNALGQKVYAYASNAPAGTVPIEIFTSYDEAARAGYSFDLTTIQ